MADASTKRSVQDLRQFLKILYRSRGVIAITILLTVGASIVFSVTQPKRYDASANILLTSSAGMAAIQQGISTALPVDRTPAVEMRILEGGAMEQELTERLGYMPEVTLSSSDPKASPYITVKASAETADEAARIANDFVTTAVAVRRETTATELKDAMEELASRSKRLSSQLAQTKLRSQELAKQIEAEKDQKKRLELEFEKLQLDDDLERGTITTQLAELRAQSDALTTALDDNSIRGSYAIGLATPPKSPTYPRPILNAVIALATGILLGCAIAFGRDYFNDTMKSKEELDEVTGGVTVLGIVPLVAEWKHREDALLESTEHPRGPAAEAYRGLRAALDFAALDHKISLMQLTSSNAGEGKTTTAANIAVTIARADRRVILVDCDLRRPRLHQFFNLDNDLGFTSVLLGECSVTEALQRPTNSPNLLVMTSGPPPPNPSELLSTKAAEELLNALTQPADMVIVDSPPLLPVADATVLARYVHSTVLVVTANSTTKRTLERSLEILSQVDAPLEGIVFNALGENELYGSGYGYGYGD